MAHEVDPKPVTIDIRLEEPKWHVKERGSFPQCVRIFIETPSGMQVV